MYCILCCCLAVSQILAETQLQKATHEAQRACENLEQQMDTFEQRKVADLKKIMTEFIQVGFVTGSVEQKHRI